MSSKRQEIVSRVKARMAAIKVADGYQTDIGLKQTEWHPTAKGADELPAHDIRDGVETANTEKPLSALYPRSLNVSVIAELTEEADTAENARKALADIIKAVGVDPTWGGLAKYTLPVEESIGVDEAGQRIGGTFVTFAVVYFRKPWEA